MLFYSFVFIRNRWKKKCTIKQWKKMNSDKYETEKKHNDSVGFYKDYILFLKFILIHDELTVNGFDGNWDCIVANMHRIDFQLVSTIWASILIILNFQLFSLFQKYCMHLFTLSSFLIQPARAPNEFPCVGQPKSVNCNVQYDSVGNFAHPSFKFIWIMLRLFQWMKDTYTTTTDLYVYGVESIVCIDTINFSVKICMWHCA